MLNPHLYAVLRRHFGEVKVSNQGVKRVEDRTPGRETVVVERGEHYNVCCPCCGDERHRLSFSYQYLCRRPMSNKRITHLVNCYNESCEEVLTPEFRQPLLEDLEAAEMGLMDDELEDAKKESAQQRVRGPIRLPNGLVPLTELRDRHPAIRFLLEKYPGFAEVGQKSIVPYLSRCYGVAYTDTYDDQFPLASGRLIFPIVQEGQVVAWQARAIRKEDKPRWYLPPGFARCFYNADNVLPTSTPVISEGIVNAICCGPNGIAVFGKEINRLQAEDFATRWSSAIIATDAETFVPDNRRGGAGRLFAHEMRDQLERAGVRTRMIRWPQEVLELATKKCNGEDVDVPDAAELGMKTMHRLLAEVGA